VQYGH